jgi:cytochrome c oxidase cbb3-type subunit 3
MAAKKPEREIDAISGVETTGHEWDGIKELNTPLPRWWLWTFYATIIWSVGYTIAYPAWPGLTGATKGVLGYSSRGEYADSAAQAAAAQSANIEKIASNEVASILADQDMARFASAGGASLYKVYCVQCHGSGAQGALGYPNLNDDEWLWGGKVDDILTTLRHGVRQAGDDDTRISEMPAFGRDELLTADQISDVAWFVRKISNQEADAAAAERGATVFAENCASCHGEAGAGNRELGAPSLIDAIWLNGSTHAAIVAQVNSPKLGVMPAWGARLGETNLKQLAVYVHSLGGGE